MRHASIITEAEEEKLWSTGVIGITIPLSLQKAIFYYVRKRFCIRGGEEQRRLGPSQFVSLPYVGKCHNGPICKVTNMKLPPEE